MKNTPITITLYDENDEVKGEYQRLIIPWNMLKRALKFRELDTNNLEKTFDELAGFVCELFGNRFTMEELGGASAHANESGVAHRTAPTEEEVLDATGQDRARTLH